MKTLFSSRRFPFQKDLFSFPKFQFYCSNASQRTSSQRIEGSKACGIACFRWLFSCRIILTVICFRTVVILGSILIVILRVVLILVVVFIVVLIVVRCFRILLVWILRCLRFLLIRVLGCFRLLFVWILYEFQLGVR